MSVCIHRGATRCWACMTDGCYREPTRHPWWDQDDVDHARATGQPDPTGECGCYFCGYPALKRGEGGGAA